jgi:hypothetical protein
MDHGDHPGVSDIFLGVELGHSFAQHHHVSDHGLAGFEHATFADNLAEAVAISVALDHGGPAHLGGLGIGTLADVMGPSAISHGQSGNADWARPVALPGIARDARAILVLQWPHGPCDPQNCIREEVAALGLKLHFPGARDGNTRWDERLRGIRLIPSEWPQEAGRLAARLEEKNIFDKHAPVAQDSERDRGYLPNGWFQGVGGSTHFWREFYQNTPSLSRWLPWGRPNYETWRTYLMVTGMTWSYTWRQEETREQISDKETLISFAVVSYPYFAVGTWRYRWDHIREHRGFSEKLAQKVCAYVGHHPADRRAIRDRGSRALNQGPASSAQPK